MPVLYAQSRSRWLSVDRLSGTVTLQTSGSRSARVGDRLTTAGHGITTSRGASAVLGIDIAIGSIVVAQSTRLLIQRLTTLSDGAEVTILDVPRGQARIQTRSFNNPNSRLELHTPSGVAAVRGTEFGVAVADDGKTSIATLEGKVDVIAQLQSVAVDAGLTSIIYPGEPPTQPQSLDRDLDIELTAQGRRNGAFTVLGQINPANTLLLDGKEVPIQRTGQFETTIPSGSRNHEVEFVVRNALGESRTHLIRQWRLWRLPRS
ncbi:MAG: FecR domain-containing protein [Cyanobacteria bacterium J06638_28]